MIRRQVPVDGLESMGQSVPQYVLGQLTPVVTELIKATSVNDTNRSLVEFLGKAVKTNFPDEVKGQLTGIMALSNPEDHANVGVLERT